MAIIKLEGQSIPIDNDIAAADELIRKALLPFYPEVGNATISRSEEDGETVINIVKRAGTKGSTPLASLIAAPEEANPAITLAWELKRLEAAEELELRQLLEYHPRIDRAIEQGEAEAEQVAEALNKLQAAVTQPSQQRIPGF